MLTDALLALPASYQGPTRQLAAPYGVLGVGEGAPAASLLEYLVGQRLTRSGTQLILESHGAALARDYAGLAEVSGAAVVRAGVQQNAAHAGSQELAHLGFLAPAGALSTYHLAQFAAYATGHTQEAARAEALLQDVCQRCRPEVEDANPARDLAWTLWNRTPLLLSAPEDNVLSSVWQQVLGRVGKVLAVPVSGEAVYTVSGAFEAQHERGDSKVALLLGDVTPELELAREVLATRIDEVVHVPLVQGESGYAGALALWYFAAWVAAYLAERYGVSSDDSPALREVLNVLASGETTGPAEDISAPSGSLEA